jgi:hypothetical protein
VAQATGVWPERIHSAHSARPVCTGARSLRPGTEHGTVLSGLTVVGEQTRGLSHRTATPDPTLDDREGGPYWWGGQGSVKPTATRK